MNERRVEVRPPRLDDRETFLAAAVRSRELHLPWIQPPSTDEEFAAYLQRYESETHVGRFVWHAESGELVGVINLNNIVRGYFQNSYLGFYGFAPHTGQGLMLEGMRLVLREAFLDLELHRVEANVQPGNTRSIRFVKRAGFRKEGFSPRYLYIDHHWCDHERWALLRDEWVDR